MQHTVGIIGGSGFVGRALRTALDDQGCVVRVISRRPGAGADVEWRCYDPKDGTGMQQAIAGCDCVVNLIGILNTRLFHPEDFHQAHVELTQRILASCKEAGVDRYLHVSALNASPLMPSRYLRTKGIAEDLAHQCPHVRTTSFRPSVVFGPGGGLLHRFAALLKLTPGIFPLACADTVFAPVYLGDLVQVMTDSIDSSKSGRRIALCGPDRYSLQEIVEYVASLIGRRVKVIALPDGLSRLQGHVLGLIPGKPFSFDNYLSLQFDSVCKEAQPCPTRMKDVGASCLRTN